MTVPARLSRLMSPKLGAIVAPRGLMTIRNAARSILIAAVATAALGGCVKGIMPDPEADAKKVEDEAAATGAGCRQSGRSLEACFARNESLNRNGALRGWRDMDEYMRQNKIEAQQPREDDPRPKSADAGSSAK